MSTSVAARSVVVTAQIEPSRQPRFHGAAASTSAMTSLERAARLPPRRMHALPDFTQTPAASAVTLGRAS